MPAPLSAEQLRELADARRRAGKVRRAAGVAGLSGWSMAVFAVLTLMGAAIGFSAAGVALGLGLGAVAAVELRGRSMLLKFNPRGAALLGYNQIALGVLLLGYAAWSLYEGLAGPVSAQLRTGDPDTDAMVGDLARTFTVLIYGSLALFAVVAPGLTALYYFSRAGHIRRFVADTPEWVVQVLKI